MNSFAETHTHTLIRSSCGACMMRVHANIPSKRWKLISYRHAHRRRFSIIFFGFQSKKNAHDAHKHPSHISLRLFEQRKYYSNLVWVKLRQTMRVHQFSRLIFVVITSTAHETQLTSFCVASIRFSIRQMSLKSLSSFTFSLELKFPSIRFE